MKAFRLSWWNRRSGKENEELDVVIVAKSITDIFNLFQREYPAYNVEFIVHVETLSSGVVVE